MDTTIHWLTLALDQIVAFLPKLLAGLVILLLGYLIGIALAKVTRTLARRLGFDRLTARLGVRDMSTTHPPSYVLGSVVFFVVIVATVMQTARVWELTFIADGLARFVAYLPHVLAAVVVFAVSLFLGNWARDRISARSPRLDAIGPSFSLLPAVARAAILAVGSFMALRELQIAPEIVNAAFMFTLASIAVAGALAFGLGARDVAGRIARSWYERRDAVMPGPAPTEVQGSLQGSL